MLCVYWWDGGRLGGAGVEEWVCFAIQALGGGGVVGWGSGVTKGTGGFFNQRPTPWLNGWACSFTLSPTDRTTNEQTTSRRRHRPRRRATAASGAGTGGRPVNAVAGGAGGVREEEED